MFPLKSESLTRVRVCVFCTLTVGVSAGQERQGVFSEALPVTYTAVFLLDLPERLSTSTGTSPRGSVGGLLWLFRDSRVFSVWCCQIEA